MHLKRSIRNYFSILWILIILFNCNRVKTDELNYDESMSFSTESSTINSETASYWNGTITKSTSKSLLSYGLRLNLYLNHGQGMLLYLIDNHLMNLWLELQTESTGKISLLFQYYSFELKVIYPSKLSLDNLCASAIIHQKISLNLLLVDSSRLLVSCNNNNYEETIFYSPANHDRVTLTKQSMMEFITRMSLPIPSRFLSSPTQATERRTNNSTSTVIYVGNVPSQEVVHAFGTLKSRHYAANVQGCVYNMLLRNQSIALSTSGNIYGPYLRRRCISRCSTTSQSSNSNSPDVTAATPSCHNSGQCIELWQLLIDGNLGFQCVCSPSRYIGQLCDKDYCRNFNSDQQNQPQNQPLNKIDLKFKMDSFQISFNPRFSNVGFSGYNLLSIEFALGQRFHLYTDLNDMLHAQVTSPNAMTKDISFQYKLGNGLFYTLFATVTDKGFYLKLSESKLNMMVAALLMEFKRFDLISSQILIGQSHSQSMQWMKQFNGQISNFVVSNEYTSYNWNQSDLYKRFPSCNPPRSTNGTGLINKLPIVNGDPDQPANNNNANPTNKNKNAEVSMSQFLRSSKGLVFILIMITIIFLITTGYILIFIHVRSLNNRHNSQHNKFNSTTNTIDNSIYNNQYPSSTYNNNNNSTIPRDDSIYTNGTKLHNSTPIIHIKPEPNSALVLQQSIPPSIQHYKPPYKARSLSSATSSPCNTFTRPRIHTDITSQTTQLLQPTLATVDDNRFVEHSYHE